ncbi:MAG: ABC transporter permease [Desulfovibrionaceae bacterium]|nr:ABC transporter permease [Desulfovibrionaceae bacterium]MBF0514986.1 ABC transporter permease [Desulfovibrionaceae bacterium]
MTGLIAVRNLLHDRMRLFVTLTGVVFSVVLIAVQSGLFVGFTTSTSCVIDNTDADVWVASKGVRNFDVTNPLKQAKYYQVLSVPGVALVKRFIVQFANWRKPAGGMESIEIVGFDAITGMGKPWNMTDGDSALLDIPDTVVFDRFYLGKLGVTGVGDHAEINDRRARIVGLTRDIRSFTTSPYVFASLRTALEYTKYKADEFTYLLVKAAPGVTPAELARAIKARVDAVDVFTSREFARATQWYWMFTTGAGMALVIAAALGLVVGGVVVAQTLYATTMDHLAEFGTLRAMGAGGPYIYKIILWQAVLSALAGYGLGISISFFVVHNAGRGGANIVLTASMAAGLFFLTLFMCTAAAMVSIHKVVRIDPAMVFKGA